jgi:hypothetical protein
MGIATVQTAAIDSTIERARDLLPMLRSHGQEIARLGRLPDSIMQAIRDDGHPTAWLC